MSLIRGNNKIIGKNYLPIRTGNISITKSIMFDGADGEIIISDITEENNIFSLYYDIPKLRIPYWDMITFTLADNETLERAGQPLMSGDNVYFEPNVRLSPGDREHFYTRITLIRDEEEIVFEVRQYENI